MTSKTLIDGFLAEPALAVVGVSRSGKGFGNVAATLLGGALIGLVENLVGLWAPAFKYVGVFCFYLLVVLWRPQGLFGRY